MLFLIRLFLKFETTGILIVPCKLSSFTRTKPSTSKYLEKRNIDINRLLSDVSYVGLLLEGRWQVVQVSYVNDDGGLSLMKAV